MRTCKTLRSSGGRVAVVVALLTGAAGAALAETPKIDWSLDDAIRQIERQADDFDSAMAQVEMIETDTDGNVVDSSTGTMFIREDGNMRYSVDGGQRTVFVDKNTVSRYDASAAKVEEYSLRKHPDRLEPFARLGFSTTGDEMRRDYLVTIVGEDQIGDSRTVVLELTPESDKARQIVRLIRLHIDQASWMPVQQEISANTTGTTLKITYTGMARNLKLKPELFRDKWPRGTKTERM